MKKENVIRVNEKLTEAKVFYLTTVNGDKPKCRPIFFHMIEDNKIYFGVGDFKEVYKQLIENSNVGICATIGSKFVRYYGEAVFDLNPEISEKALEMLSMMRNIYYDQTGYNLKMFYLSNASAEFYNMMGLQESITL